MSFTRKVKFPLTNHVDATGIAHSNLFESEYSRLGLVGSHDQYTKLLLHCNGTDGSQLFTDEIGHTMTAAGSVQIDTAQSRFGGASASFNSASDYIYTPDSPDWDLAAGEWTVEAWVRYTSKTPAYPVLAGQWGAVGNYGWIVYLPNSLDNNLYFQYSTTGSDLPYKIVAWTPALNTWYHFMMVRSANVIKVFINGVQVGSDQAFTETIFNSSANLQIGAVAANGYNGHYDEIRISKGIARHTSGFTPPTAEYTVNSYPTNSPSPATVWTALQSGDVVDMSTAKVWMYKDGVVQAAGNTDITFKYAANNGSVSASKTLTQLRAETDVTVTDETNSFKIYGLYASDGNYKSESETWIEFNVISAAAGGGSYLLDGGLIR